MTYNVNFGLAGDDAGLAAIEAGGAELVFLQEVTPGWEQALRSRLARRYPRMAFHHAPGAGGLAVLSRHPFEGEVLPSTVGWFPAWRVVVATPIGRLQVLQLHLRPPVSDRGSWVSGYFTTRGFRRGEAERFSASLDPALPTLVVGDLNEADQQAVRYLKGRGLRSALEEAQPFAATWRWRTSVGPIVHRLDHILYSRGLLLRGARVLEAGRSDHLPVVAELAAVPRR